MKNVVANRVSVSLAVTVKVDLSKLSSFAPPLTT